MPPLKAAEILAHPAFATVEWTNMPPTQEGTATVAKDERRNGGPLQLYWQIHGRGERRVVWIMGLGAYYTAWKRQTHHFGHLHGDKYSSLVFDNRGIGRSDKPFCRYSTSEMARDVIDLLRHVGWLDPDNKEEGEASITTQQQNPTDVKSTRRTRNLHVVGISMGGMIAQELALLIPESIASLCLVSTAPRLIRTVPFLDNLRQRAMMFIPRDVDAELDGVAKRLFGAEFLVKKDDEWAERPDEETFQGMEDGKRCFPTNQDRVAALELKKRMDVAGFTKRGFMMQAVAAGWHSKSAVQLKELAERVGRGRIEVHHGTGDGMLVFKHGEVLVQELNDGLRPGEEKVQFHVYEGDGHVLPWERKVDFNRKVEALIEKGERMSGR